MTETPTTPPGVCVYCHHRADTTSSHRVTVMTDHPDPGTGAHCPGSGIPPATGDEATDTTRARAVEHSQEAAIDLLKQRQRLIEALADTDGPTSLIVEIQGHMVASTSLNMRWRTLAYTGSYTQEIASALGFLTGPPATGTDAFLDTHMREGTRAWLRAVARELDGTTLGELLRDI